MDWIQDAARLARAGHIQITLLLLSLTWTLVSVWRQRRWGPAYPTLKTANPLRYEFASQFTRSASLICITVEATKSSSQWPNVALLSYVFLLGLVRLVRAQRQDGLLHQVNMLLAAACLLLGVSDMLPLLNLNHQGAPTTAVLGAFGALTVSLGLAAATPRQWTPSPVPDEITGLLPEGHPSLEETCSWLNYYITYNWMNPLMWKGWRHQVTMEDLPTLPSYDDPVFLLHRVVRARGHARSTLQTVFRFMGKEITLMCICKYTPKEPRLYVSNPPKGSE